MSCDLGRKDGVIMFRWSRLWRPALAGAAAMFAAVAVAVPATAEPATTVSYPAWASATRYTGLAFDICSAPSLAAMQAWGGTSPYDAIGVYVGGQTRTCSQPELTRSWVGAVSVLGWRLIPIYKGRQPPCGGRPSDLKIVPAVAASEGTWAAGDASEQAKALGMLKGSLYYYIQSKEDLLFGVRRAEEPNKPKDVGWSIELLQTARSQGRKVLVVEDEKDIRDLVRYNLEAEGFSVVEASDGEVGLLLATRERPALVVGHRAIERRVDRRFDARRVVELREHVIGVLRIHLCEHRSGANRARDF
jgi:CheY-like chemotaxis protein